MAGLTPEGFSTMKIKEGVALFGLNIVMRPVLERAEKVWQEFGQELVITSTVEGEHKAGSLHYYGYAVDFRTRYFADDVKNRVAETLRKRLTIFGNAYRVVVKSDHIHVEYRHILKREHRVSTWI